MTPRKRKKPAPLTVLQRQERQWDKLDAAAVRDGVQIKDKHTGEWRQATKGEAIGAWRDHKYTLIETELLWQIVYHRENASGYLRECIKQIEKVLNPKAESEKK